MTRSTGRRCVMDAEWANDRAPGSRRPPTAVVCVRQHHGGHAVQMAHRTPASLTGGDRSRVPDVQPRRACPARSAARGVDYARGPSPRFPGGVAQRKSARLTIGRSLVRHQPSPQPALDQQSQPLPPPSGLIGSASPGSVATEHREIAGVPAGLSRVWSTRRSRAAQADAYAESLDACLAVAASTSSTMWGFTDRHSWVPGFFDGQGADACDRGPVTRTGVRRAAAHAPAARGTVTRPAGQGQTGPRPQRSRRGSLPCPVVGTSRVTLV